MEQKQQQNLALKALNWNDIRQEVKQLDAKLFEIIESIQPSSELTIYEATYQYGDIIYDDYQVHLPQKQGQSVPLNSEHISDELRQALSYQPMPLSLVAQKTIESFFASEDRIFSLAYNEPGTLIGAEEQFDNNNPFTITAGSRSLHLLPRITESTSHRRLKDFGVDIGPPKRPFDQWHVFRRISHSEACKTSWRNKIYLFSQDWMQKIVNDPQWQPLYTYLLQKAWDNCHYARNKLALDTFWEHFSRIMVNKRIKPRTYVFEMFKHLTYVILGSLPAFAPACDNNAAPVDDLTRIYLQEYGLKYYTPSFMQPGYFDINNPQQNYVYYSLQLPTYLESVPRTRNPISARADLIEFTNLHEQFMYELETNPKIYPPVDLKSAFDQVTFDYFHNSEDQYAGIQPTSEMPKQDPRLTYLPSDLANEGRIFCERGTFARGCIRISPRQK